MIYIFYLAAGQSRRFGANKLLTPYQGKALFCHGLDVLRETVKDREDCTLRVVTCWREIEEVASAAGLCCVSAPDSHLGISYTIRAAIRSVQTLHDEDYLVFAVADQPRITSATIQRLLDTTKEQPVTACLASGKVSGNPVVFAASLAEELCALEGDRGGKAVMRRHPEDHIDVPCCAWELEDVDTQSDL